MIQAVAVFATRETRFVSEVAVNPAPETDRTARAASTVEARGIRHPTRQLLRSVFGFAAVDNLYIGFSMAYAYKTFGLSAALLYLAGLYVVATAGFWLGLIRLRRNPQSGGRILREGMLATSARLVLS